MQAPEVAIRKDVKPRHRGRKADGLPRALREVCGMVKRVAIDAPLVRPDMEKIETRLELIIQSARKVDAECWEEDEWVWNWLHVRYNGRIQADIRALPEVDEKGAPHEDNIRAKERFRRRGMKV